jgi:glycopeptide antibiotics resistance protein
MDRWGIRVDMTAGAEGGGGAQGVAPAEGVRRTPWQWVLFRVVAMALGFLALVAFAVVLAKLTLVPSPASEGLVHSNLRPGASLRQYLEDYTFLAACKQVGGNVLLGVPFGVLLPVVGARRLRFLRMLLITVAVMVLVELAQGAIVAGRAFDVDDVIMNTGGALLGYLVLGRRLGQVVHQKRLQPRPRPRPRSRLRWPRPGRPPVPPRP